MQPNVAADESDDYSSFEVAENLVLVSNREPYRHRFEDDDSGESEVTVDTPAGGLAMGLDPVMQRIDGTWIAWGDGDADFSVTDEDGQVAVPPSDPSYTLQRVDLTADQVKGYYDGYANQALWPLCHSATGKLNFDADHWECYREVNEHFADLVDAHADADSTIWFQDYHFTLAPRMVRANNPEAFLMQFFHIPWPAPDIFRVCPQAEAILEGLLGNDLLGFHTPRYGAQFLQCVDQLLDAPSIDWTSGSVSYEGNTTRIESFPLSVDAENIRQTTVDADETFWTRFRHKFGIDRDTTVAIGVDRLDYTKGIPERLDALERLFETRPELRGELTYVQKASPTRERIPAYQQLRETVEDGVERLNERFGTEEWSPVVYTTEMYNRSDLFAMYRNSEIGLVGPLRDGLNLVAKEYIAAQLDNDGVLLLSPFAGAEEQLGFASVEFDPYDTASAADAIERAVEMGDVERRARMRALRRQVHDKDLAHWLDDVLSTAEDIRTSTTPHAAPK